MFYLCHFLLPNSPLAVLVRGVPSPSFKRAQHNELRRLVHACDVFYDLRARLRVVAEGVGSASPVLEAPLELASLFSSFLPVEDALAGPSSRSTSEGGSSAVPDTLSTKPTVFVADDDTTAGKGRSNKKLLQDTTDAPASNILSVRVEEAAKATLHMGIRRALSRLVEMAASDSSASSSSSSPSAAAAPSAPAARAFDALNRALLVDQVPQSVKATLLK